MESHRYDIGRLYETISDVLEVSILAYLESAGLSCLFACHFPEDLPKGVPSMFAARRDEIQLRHSGRRL